jgi:DNA invertase Pin-like site-specific DNA recombinase
MSRPNEAPLAFSYLRFSTPDQQRGDSFRRQTDLAERYARDHGLRLDSRSFADLGVSAFRGANLQTGKLGEFLEAVRRGIIPAGSYLLMESLDRMSRADPWDAVIELRNIVRAGVKVVTLSTGRVYGGSEVANEWELMEAVIVLTLAHQESAMKARRLKAVWHKKREDAPTKPMTSIAPAWVKLRADRRGFDLVPDRAEVVRGIFAAFLGGEGTHSIAQRLNRDGVKPFGRAKFWHRSYVSKILDNPAATGEFTPHTVEHSEGKRSRRPHDPIPGYYPAVVDLETFARAKAMRTAKRGPAQAAGTRKVSHLLAGLARCPHCRSAMLRVNKGSGPKGGHPYLVCSRAKAGAGCEYRGIRIDYLEPAILAAVPALIRQMPQGSPTVADVEKRLAEERRKLESSIRRYLDFLEDGPSEAVREKLAEDETRLAKVKDREREVGALKAGRNVVSRSVRLRELQALVAAQEFDYPSINAVLRQLFRRVVVHWDIGALDFHWHHGGRTRLALPNVGGQ